MGLLDDEAASIFELKHVPLVKEMPDKIAQRKRCKDFEQFEPLFKQCHAELAAGIVRHVASLVSSKSSLVTSSSCTASLPMWLKSVRRR